MRVLLLSVVLLSHAASAQVPEAAPAPGSPSPTSAQMAVVAVVGVGCGALAGLAASAAGGAVLPLQEAAALVGAAALATGTAACVWGLGRRVGVGGRFLPTLGDAALGVGLGTVAGLGVGYVAYHAAGGDDSGGDGFFNQAAIVALLAAGATVAVMPALVATLRLPRHSRTATAAPAVLAVPGGASAPGVVLRIGL